MKQFIIILSLVLLSNSVFAEMYFCEETYRNGFNDSEDKREYKPVDRFSVSSYTIVRTEKEVCMDYYDDYDRIDKVYSASEYSDATIEYGCYKITEIGSDDNVSWGHICSYENAQDRMWCNYSLKDFVFSPNGDLIHTYIPRVVKTKDLDKIRDTLSVAVGKCNKID